MSNSSSPCAGWLNKISRLPFGPNRCQRRFFVLLDSELRCYKDEHANVPLHSLSLHTIHQVRTILTEAHHYSFQLIPTPTANHKTCKTWMFACSSRVERDQWVEAIQSRLQRFHKISHTEIQPMPCLRPNKTPAALLQRRGVAVSPIDVKPSVFSIFGIVSPDTSPVTAPLLTKGFPSPPQRSSLDAISEHSVEMLRPAGRSNSAPSIFDCRQTISDGESSPTFLLYKEKFNL